MHNKSRIVFKALMDRSVTQKKLLSYVTQEEADQIENLPSFPLFSLAQFLTPKLPLTQYHYSWLVPKMRALSTENQILFLSLFSKEESDKIQQILKTNFPLTPLPPLLQYPLAQQFAKKLGLEESLPKECLPETDLLPLLTLEKSDLLRLIDLLAIYDLAADLRQIVDKTVLSKIASSLTLEQRQFLQYASKQSLRYLPKRMNLQDTKGLQRLLHKRGLERLGGALADEKQEFLDSLFHTLDTGRADFLEKIRKEKRDESLVKFFKRQVIQLVHRIQS